MTQYCWRGCVFNLYDSGLNHVDPGVERMFPNECAHVFGRFHGFHFSFFRRGMFVIYIFSVYVFVLQPGRGISCINSPHCSYVTLFVDLAGRNATTVSGGNV